MLLENINSNLEDMLKMTSNLQSLTIKNAQTESQNRALKMQVRQLRERNDQMSLSILQDQSKISGLNLQFETAKKDIEGYLKIIEELREMKKNLEEKNDEMVEVINKLREERKDTPPQEVEKNKKFENHVEATGGESFFVSLKKKKKNLLLKIMIPILESQRSFPMETQWLKPRSSQG